MPVTGRFALPLVAMDQLRVTDIALAAVIGVNPDERKRAQPLRLRFELELNLDLASQSDRLADAPDYAALTEAVIAHAQASQFQLLEALAGSLLSLILAFDPRIEAATVGLAKPEALSNGTVEIEMRRRR